MSFLSEDPHPSPGPWKWNDAHRGLIDANGNPVLHWEKFEGMSLNPNRQHDANGKLLEAAPALLELAKKTMSFCRSLIEDGEVSTLDTNDLWEEARNAIKSVEPVDLDSGASVL